jgi:hypothetical protein
MAVAKARKRPARKTTAKSAEVPKVPQPHGGALNAGGTPGNKGGGRPPKAFKNFLAELRNDPDAQDALARAAKDPALGSFGAAWKLASEYDDDKPAKKIEVVEALTTAERAEKVRKILERAKASG